jgi:hypothetical protein
MPASAREGPAGNGGRTKARQRAARHAEQTKRQLQQELREARKLLEKHEVALSSSEEELAAATGRAASAESELSALRRTADERLAEISALTSRIHRLQSQAAGSNREKTGGKTADGVSVPASAMMPEDSSRSMFRVVLYALQGHVRGEIEHPFTGDRAVLSGIDRLDEMRSFMEKHRPRRAAPAATGDDRGEGAPSSRVASRKIESKSLPVVSGLTMTSPDGKLGHRFKADSDIEVHFRLQPPDDRQGAVRYQATVSARPYGRGDRRPVGEGEETVRPNDPCMVRISPSGLKPGLYRLEAAVSFATPGGLPYPGSGFAESRPFWVD